MGQTSMGRFDQPIGRFQRISGARRRALHLFDGRLGPDLADEHPYAM
jgi:hypothetical protein